MDLYTVYPKQFRKIKIPIERDRCFVLMPFSEEYDRLYGLIKDTLTNMGVNCLRDDEIFGSQPFMNKVLNEILRSRYLIVILTDYRPNVLYELGIAHCFKDVENVLILIDKKSKIGNSIHEKAADLSHLTYIEYDINNGSMIRSNIREFINTNKSAFDLQDYLYEHEIISSITENTNDFISYIGHKFGNSFTALTDLLMGNDIGLKDKQTVLELCNTELYNQIDKNGDYIEIMIKVFAEGLLAANDPAISDRYVQNFIHDEMYRKRTISTTLIMQWKMEFVIYLARREHFLDVLVPWIINYLRRTKSSTIDLNRYKLESFLINTTIRKIDESLCNALRETDFHIREHLSDIIGEKHLSIAYPYLFNALVNETSLYAGKSIIVALGKIATGSENDAANIIINWLDKNIERIVASGQDFTNSILTKSRVAIQQLYPEYINKFDHLFYEYITITDY